MNSMKNRILNAKKMHIDYRSKTSTDSADQTDDMFFDYSDPINSENLSEENRSDMIDIIFNHLQLPGYRQTLNQKSPRSIFDEAFFTTSKS